MAPSLEIREPGDDVPDVDHTSLPPSLIALLHNMLSQPHFPDEETEASEGLSDFLRFKRLLKHGRSWGLKLRRAHSKLQALSVSHQKPPSC